MISLIAAMGKNRVIGKDGGMPWHLPADLQHFKQITLHKPVIMGRKTYQSIGKPLPQRKNIVVTGDLSFTAPGCEIVYQPLDAIELTQDAPEAIVMGGRTLYEYFLPMADRLYLTLIQARFEGDTYFPDWNDGSWVVANKQIREADAKNPHDCEFLTLVKKTP